MPDFEYRAVDSSGRVIRETATAESEARLVESLREKGCSILEVRAAAKPIKATRKVRMAWEPFGVPEKSIVFFSRQFATTLVAGLPLLRALNTLQAQNSSPRLRRVLGDVGHRIQQGSSLAEAMTVHRGTFNDLFLSMIRVGEASGSLDRAASRLADMLEKDFALKRKVKGALAYPLFVLAFSLILVYGMIAFLLPGFTPIFESSGLDIPRDYPMTQMLIEASKVATDPIIMGGFVVAMILTLVALRVINNTDAGRLALDTIKINFPFFSGLIQLATLTRFCRTFGTLTASGVPLLECLKLVGTSSGNMLVARSIQRVSREIQGGDKISATLARIPLFPPLLVQMVTVGEETGTLDNMFHRIADYYEQELEVAVSSITSLIEPAMMIFVGGIVGFFVMGVLLPILGISTAMQNQM